MAAATEVEVRIGRDGTIRLRRVGDPGFAKVSRTRLARDYAADHPVWQRLRSRGVQRPSPSGPTMSAARRDRAPYALRLLPEEARELDELAERWGLTRSQTVVRMVRSARAPRTRKAA
jgi:hypothetical protein